MPRLLDKVDSPADLKKLTQLELGQLAAELREELVNTVTTTGGHLASNLGVVELTMALHRVFDSPRDKIIWDVGHQSYSHKLLPAGDSVFPRYVNMAAYPVLPSLARVNMTLLAPVTPAPRYQPLWVWPLLVTFPVTIIMWWLSLGTVYCMGFILKPPPLNRSQETFTRESLKESSQVFRPVL